MATNRLFKTRYVTLIQQDYFMRVAYPQFRCSLSSTTAKWIGMLQPTSLSDAYSIEINYAAHFFFPEVKILEPELRIHPAHQKLPHFYQETKLLCLHEIKEWRPEFVIAHTIMQWISGWLYFYEVWFATSFWLGGGTHPSAPQHRSQ